MILSSIALLLYLFDAPCGLHLHRRGKLRHALIQGHHLYGRIHHHRRPGRPHLPYYFLAYLKGIHLLSSSIEITYHLDTNSLLQPYLKLHLHIRIPRFMYLAHITIQHFNLFLEFHHQLSHLRHWINTMRPSPR